MLSRWARATKAEFGALGLGQAQRPLALPQEQQLTRSKSSSCVIDARLHARAGV